MLTKSTTDLFSNLASVFSLLSGNFKTVVSSLGKVMEMKYIFIILDMNFYDDDDCYAHLNNNLID